MTKITVPVRASARWFESAIGYASGVSERINRDEAVIRGVRVVGTRSRNGHEYLQEALVGAIPLYEGAKICINHIKPKKGEPVPERQFEQIWGTLRNVRWFEGGLVGDIHYIRSHALTEQILEAAERFPENFGLSHDADGIRTEIGGRPVIQKITKVYSVDIVADPASNVSLFESMGSVPSSRGRRSRAVVRAVVGESLAVSGSLKEGFTWGGQVMSKNVDRVRLFEEAMTDELASMGAGGMGDEMLGATSASESMKEGMDGGADLASAFKAAVVAVLDDASLDSMGKFAKIKAILKAHDTAMAAVGGDSGSAEGASTTEGKNKEGYDSDEEDEENMQESASVKALQAKLDAMQKELELRDARAEMTKLLESSNREVTDVRLNALLRAPEAERKALLDSFPVREKAGAKRPASSPSALRESVSASEYPKSYADFKQRLN